MGRERGERRARLGAPSGAKLTLNVIKNVAYLRARHRLSALVLEFSGEGLNYSLLNANLCAHNDYRARPGFDGSSEVRLGHVEG